MGCGLAQQRLETETVQSTDGFASTGQANHEVQVGMEHSELKLLEGLAREKFYH